MTSAIGNGRSFEERVAVARGLLNSGRTDELVERMRTGELARAVVMAWTADVELARATMTARLLRALREPGVEISGLTTIALIRLLLSHFDRLDLWGPEVFEELSMSAGAAVASQPRRRLGIIETARTEGSYFLHRQGPRALALHLLQTGGSLGAWMRAHHLDVGSRFHLAAMDAYYLTQIELADPLQEDHPFLAEVTREAVARRSDETDATSRFMFGHSVLKAMLDKSVRRPSDAWFQAIVDIAGDPRDRGTVRWETWWGRLGAGYLRVALRWFAGADLRAFLDGIEQYARATSNDGMVRMLERRARLLNGLYEQDLVQDVRLILGNDIRSWVRKATSLDLFDAPKLIDSGRTDTAVIYLDCGNFSVLEGSHNFKLILFTRGSVDRLANRLTRSFTGLELREDIPLTFGGRFESFTHDQYGAWVRNALAYLRSEGIRVDERQLVNAQDYQELLRRRARDGY